MNSFTANSGLNGNIDYLQPYRQIINLPEIEKVVQKRQSFLHRKDCPPFWDILNHQPDIAAKKIDLSNDCVQIGATSEIDSLVKEKIEQQLRGFCAWRKGPYSIFGIDIDAEWRSDWKWQRIKPHLDPLTDKKICDVGCNNGYYMFRMASYQPELVLGLDPVHRYKFTFSYLQNFARQSNLNMELLGWEHLPLFPAFFDTIFLMGIVYHHRNPIQILEYAWQALKPGGQIIVDTMGIPGHDPIALFPGKRYGKIPGIWFLPTAKTLENWLAKSQFYDIQCIYNELHTIEEQRRTSWSLPESLQEFLDPHDTSKTVEGFPRPWRIYTIARKKPKNFRLTKKYQLFESQKHLK